MPLKGLKKKGYNKKYYKEHKEKIADKRRLTIEKISRKVAQIVQLEAATVI